jgi:filamentous hemagglutinin family protein
MKNIAPALRRSFLLQVLILVFLTPGLILFPVRVNANPYGQDVVAGNVNFQGLGTSQLDINNLSNRAIINWQSFSIQSGETTNINQGANAFTLNRVVSGNPTAIFGQLNAAQGGVAVINPNGIVVHSGGSIDVAGMLTLSTLDITNEDFLDGGSDRFQGTSAAGIKNYGTITSANGDVVLLANFLQNAGEVNAPRGIVAFGAGGDMIVDHAGGAKISVQGGGSGNAIGIENSGTINAAASELIAHGNVYALAIKNDGVIRASGYNFSGGKLTLSAGSSGRIVNNGILQARNSDGSGGRVSISGGQVDLDAGVIDAAGNPGQVGGNVTIAGSGVNVGAAANVTAVGSAGGTVSISSTGLTSVNGSVAASGNSAAGGRVTVEGVEVAVGSQARVDVSGETGGGTAMIGGGFRGKDTTLVNADNLTVDSGAVIIADAVGSGKGGNVILWSDGDTLFAGELSARGITGGGFAEISGKSTLDVVGSVDLTTQAGAGGTLLLDPTNIVISSVGASALGGSTISNVWLSNQLDAGTNVVISTNSLDSQAGNITVGRLDSTAISAGDQIEWYQDSVAIVGGTLSLLAMGDIRFNSSVHSAGAGGVNVVAGWDGNTGLVMGAFNMADVLATMNDGNTANDAAGLYNTVNGSFGSVQVGGTGTQTMVDVGSRWGATQVAGHDLFLTGSILRAYSGAQIGFMDNGVEYELSKTQNGLVMNEWWGNAAGNVTGKNYIALLGGTEFGTGDTDPFSTHANAFRGAGWGATGDITIGMSGRLQTRGGTTGSYTQIGHGGILADGAEWKRDQNAGALGNPITTQTTRDGIVIDPGVGRRSFFASTWRTNYAGDAARIDADIVVKVDGDIVLMGSRDFDIGDDQSTSVNQDIYSMIGHGGGENRSSTHGDITVIANGTTPAGFLRGPEGLGIQLIGGRGTRSFVQIGHGSGYEGNPRSVWDQTRSGDIIVTATTGGIRLLGHNQDIVEGDINSGAPVPGDVPTSLGNASDSSNLGSHVQIGHGGAQSDFPAAGGIFIMPGGTNVTNITPDSSMTGDITVFAGGTFVNPKDTSSPVGIQVQAGNRRWYHAMIGHGGTNMRAENVTDQTPNFGPGAITPFGSPTLAASVGFQGNIRVEADKGDVVVAGGDTFRPHYSWGYGYNFGQIGHGGDVVRGPKGGTITVLAGQGVGAVAGNISFTAGRMYRDHAMLGHGGMDSDSTAIGGWDSLTKTVVFGANTAEIKATARGGISFVSPLSGDKDALGLSPDYAYWFFSNSSPTGTPQTNQAGYWSTEDRFVQLGHGGYASTTVIPDKQDITVTSGTGDMANADGDVTTGGVTFIAGDMERDYAQLGHGGHSASANNAQGFTGDITVTANGGGLRFDGSVLGAQGVRRVTDVSLNGIDFAIPVANGLAAPVVVTRGNGGGYEAYVQLGHGGYGARGVHSGDITVNTWGGIDFLAALAAPKVARTVINAPIDAALAAGTNVWIALANLRDTAAPDISSFRYQTPEIYSNIVPGSVRIVLSNGDVITDLPNNSSDERTSKLILNGGAAIGDINYDNGLVRFQTGGAPGPVVAGGTTGAVATFETAQGLKERSYAQLGHGGYESEGPNNKANDLPSMSGNITIGAAGDINFQAGASHRTYAQLGHGGWDVKGVKSGDIKIDHVDATHLVGGIQFIAGHGGYRQFDYHSYAQLGHGGNDSDGNMFGNIFVRGTQNSQGVGLLFKAGDHQDSYVQLGHGGFNSKSGTGDGALSFGMNGDIDVQVGGTVAFVAGTMANTNPLYDEDGRLYAQLGHGGYNADPSNNDTSNFSQTRTNPLLPTGTAGAGEGSWGHFGDIKLVTTSGDISFMAGSTIPVANRLDFDGNALPINDPLGLLTSYGTGYGRIHTAQAGHGGYATGGNHQGNITITAENGGVNVVGGMLTTELSTQQLHYAQIGHGGANSPGNLGGPDAFIKVYALGGNVVVMGGEARTNSGQIGHGATHTSSGLQNDINADITVIARNSLFLNSGNAILDTNWGKIGHGEVRNNGTGTLNGDIHISIGDTLKMGRALIGHLDYKIDPSSFLRSTRGDTFIAVSRNNPNPGGTGDFITTNQSLITSAGSGTIGEVRLYMPDPSANQIAEGTFVSNVNYTRTPAPGSGRADENLAVEHAFPASNLTEADAQFTPEGAYPFQAFGLYNIYYAGPTPPTVIPPVVGTGSTPGSSGVPRVFTPFSFNTFFFGDTYDAYDRNGMLIYYDGYDEVLDSVAYTDAMEKGGDPSLGTWFLEEMLDSRFGSRRYSQIEPGGTVLEGERDEELLRRKLVAGRQVGRGGLTYYVFDPATNRYSSYRLFGVPQTSISVTE